MEHDFATLHEVNEYVNDHCAEFPHMNVIGNIYQKVRDQLRDAGNTLGERQAQVELCCFSFWIRDGELASMFSGLTENNETRDWPSVKEFKPDDLAFIEERLAHLRVQEAIDYGAEILATACPFCVLTLEDAVKIRGLEDQIRVMDIMELVAQATQLE